MQRTAGWVRLYNLGYDGCVNGVAICTGPPGARIGPNPRRNRQRGIDTPGSCHQPACPGLELEARVEAAVDFGGKSTFRVELDWFRFLKWPILVHAFIHE